MKELKERLFENSIPEPNTGCWLWTKSTRNGYGRIRVNGKKESAHRISFLLFNGMIPESMGVLHKCDTPSCINPEHLWVGTHRDNMMDALKKGRSRIFLKKSYCKKGIHEYSEENTCINSSGVRYCRPCWNYYQLNYYHKNKRARP